jgi:hypothetical protein
MTPRNVARAAPQSVRIAPGQSRDAPTDSQTA